MEHETTLYHSWHYQHWICLRIIYMDIIIIIVVEPPYIRHHSCVTALEMFMFHFVAALDYLPIVEFFCTELG